MDMDIKKLTVLYNGTIVGYLQTFSNSSIGFQYSRNWIHDGFSISPFSLPLTDKVYISKSPYFEGMFGVFYDSLPDGWANLLLQRFLSKKGIRYETLSALSKLSLLGEDSLGGLSYEPSENIEIDCPIDFDRLCKECNRIIENKEVDNLDAVYALGGSSGGSRPKVHVKIGEEDWIVKFPCSYDPKDIGIKEYEANRIARSCGIRTNDYRLFESKCCKGYFGAKRFDRKNGKRIHMISLSALLETTHRIPNLDYKHLFQVIRRVCTSESEIYEGYRRMCFNVLYGNKDDHGKNFAFLYDEDHKSYILSPFYDITKTENRLEHEMTCLGKGNPTEKDLREMGKTIGISAQTYEKIIAEIKTAIQL